MGDKGSRAGRGSRLAMLAGPLLLAAASCAQRAAPSAILDPGKVGTVVVGRSTRADVFTALGQPSRTERSAGGEAWVYEARTGDPGRGWMSGVSAASGVAGAFVPYVGLIGSGLGLAGAGADALRADPQVVGLAVTFREDGVVRDCAYSSTAAPAGVPGSPANASALIDCQRPLPGAVPAR